jgi:hypothetical protein
MNITGATNLYDPRTQLTTAKHGQQLFEHTHTSSLYGLGTRNSVFQPKGVRSQTHTHVYTRRFPKTDCSTNQCEEQYNTVTYATM